MGLISYFAPNYWCILELQNSITKFIGFSAMLNIHIIYNIATEQATYSYTIITISVRKFQPKPNWSLISTATKDDII